MRLPAAGGARPRPQGLRRRLPLSFHPDQLTTYQPVGMHRHAKRDAEDRCTPGCSLATARRRAVGDPREGLCRHERRRTLRRRRRHQGRVLPSLQEQGGAGRRRSGALVGDDRGAVCGGGVSRPCRPARSRPWLRRVPQGTAAGRGAGLHLPRRHDGAGDLRDQSGHSRCLRSQHQQPCRDAGSRHRSGDPGSGHAPGLDRPIACAHTQAVLQGAFILAKAKGGAEIAADSVDHLARYLELLFGPARIEHPS